MGKTWENTQWNGWQNVENLTFPNVLIFGMATNWGFSQQFWRNSWGSSVLESFPILQLVPILSEKIWCDTNPTAGPYEDLRDPVGCCIRCWTANLCESSCGFCLLKCASGFGCQQVCSLLLRHAAAVLFLRLCPFYVPQDAITEQFKTVLLRCSTE